MNKPAPSSVLDAAAMARRLSALALWFATLLARILPGSAKRRAELEMWQYIEATMAQFAELLERHAAGELVPAHPTRKPSRRPSRPASADTRTPRAQPARQNPSARPAPQPPQSATPWHRAPINTPSLARTHPVTPSFSKMSCLTNRHTHALIVTII